MPDNIQWQNMSVIALDRFRRKVIAWAISIVIIILAFIFILFFKQLGLKVDNQKFKLVSTKYCMLHEDASKDLIDNIVEKTAAYLDYLQKVS